MLKFVIDLGTLLNIFLMILYLIIVISFQFVKIGSWGLKRNICMKSEEIWHKVHVAASYATMPFVLISIVMIFVNNMWFKIVMGLVLLFLLPRVWDIVVIFTTKTYSQELKKKNRKS